MTLVGPPLTGPITVTDFATFNVAAGTVYFNLSNINTGYGTAAGCANAIGVACTPIDPATGTMSPFTLTQVTSNSVAISLTLSGMAYLNTNSGSDPSQGIFTTQTVDGTTAGTVTGILAEVFTPSGFTSSYSATFTATPVAATPEPASLLLMGVGLLGAGIIARKKIRS